MTTYTYQCCDAETATLVADGISALSMIGVLVDRQDTTVVVHVPPEHAQAVGDLILEALLATGAQITPSRCEAADA